MSSPGMTQDAAPSRFGIDVLAFGPHPDDLEIFCGGTLISLADLGYRTGAVDLTRGELATYGTPEQRADEANAAGHILGLKFRENLGLPDGFIYPWSGYEKPGDKASTSQLARVVEVIRRRRPEIILIPWIEERHPDHAAAGVLLTRAVFFAGLQKFETDPPSTRFVPRQLLYYQMRYRMTPSFIMDTSASAERKRQAIACYSSQLMRDMNDTPTLIGAPHAMNAIAARDQFYGSMIGTKCGEPLRAPNAMGLLDPVAHFRLNPFPEAHAYERLR